MAKHILVVDDNRHIRKAMCAMILRDARFAPCSEAENGFEGVHKPAAMEPDLVIKDFLMPGMLEAAHRIKVLIPNMPIILVTLHSELMETANVAMFGITAMVSKQQVATELLPAICSLLGLSCAAGAA